MHLTPQSCLELATTVPSSQSGPALATNRAQTLQPLYPILNRAQFSPPIVPKPCDHRTEFSPSIVPNLTTTVPSSQSCPTFATNCAQTSRPSYPVLNRAQSSPPIMPSPCRHPLISNFEDHERVVRLRRMHEVNQEVVLLSLCSKTFTSKVIVFSGTKQSAHRLNILFGFTCFKATELHGNLTQVQLLDALELFRKQQVYFLISTNVAARDLMEKTIVLALATGQKRFSVTLCKLVEKYAEISASQGQLTMALEYIKLLGSEELTPELVILRD
ncbi:DEAD-box ATP-dependent RNA helicase 28 isoform X2 [Cucumis melo var. makuwa]|uniref:DEAD-box ATP-dependent RNA helicase 28 isoform X2 n=1 Tax=Cucumis melo var. makuwa TaxID=1194695 RepID=A0A5A7TIN1_CUCMM|nr:DEAD-box ATP-dependent RNA helicase 28 isoform X2 [Cucumis melo var. makuwa]TYK24374.1 DEAD-box ATP-dependent RNA helicase 28 isoform X2 [Cucumis melo var. makuwa]